MVFAFVPIALLAHIIEELPRFPAWATKHFGTTTLEWYIISHLVLYPIVVMTSYLATRNDVFWIILAMAIQVVILTNGLLHIFTTFLFKEYSPGLLTTIFITLPFSFLFAKNVLPLPILHPSNIIVATVSGLVVSVLIILSLFLNMNLSFLHKN